MGKLKEYNIAFSGLKTGFHHFELSAGKSFFKEYKALAIEEGDLEIVLELEKQERMLIFAIDIRGSVDLICDRCLETYQQPVDIHKTLYVKLQNGIEHLIEESEDVLLLPDTESDFDISHYIYEFISLAIPMKKTHGFNQAGESLCNQEMIDLLEKKKQNAKGNKENKETDPRWDALKKLRNQN